MVTPVSILPLTGRPLYTDSPAPHNVSAISPLDPQLFTTIDQHAKDLISGTKNTGCCFLGTTPERWQANEFTF